MYSYEERLTREFFGRLAGRKLSDEEVKEIVEHVHRVAEFVRENKWVARKLGVDRPKQTPCKAPSRSV